MKSKTRLKMRTLPLGLEVELSRGSKWGPKYLLRSENQMGKNRGHQMETGDYLGVCRGIIGCSGLSMYQYHFEVYLRYPVA